MKNEQLEEGESVNILRKKLGQVSLSFGDATTVTATKAEDPAKQVESDSESEPSEEEVSDEESSEEVDDFECLCLHRLHFAKSRGSIKPVVIESCGSAQKLADRALYDLKVRGNPLGCQKVHSVIKKSEMEIMGEGISSKVQLLRADVAFAELNSGFPEDLAIVAVVPTGEKGPEWCSKSERERKSAEGVEGWVFTCPKPDVSEFMDKIGYAGGIRSGLTSKYHLHLQGKQGLGALGFVACAVELKTDKVVAVKNLKLQVNPVSIFKEADMLRAGQGHPNIVRFLGLWADPTPSSDSKSGKQWYMVMDYYKGDLYDRIVESRRLREKECIPILHNVLSAILFLHNRQIFHRDIKPENLLMDTAARVVLTDFGIACLATDEDELKRTVGTVGYAAPEMLAGTATGPEGDEFGAGIVLYFMLSKSTPFLAPTPQKTIEKTMEGKVNLGYGCFDHISENCRMMINRLICKDVDKRIRADEALRQPYLMSRASMTEPVLDCSVMQPKKSQRNLPSIKESSSARIENKFACATQGNLPLFRPK